MVHADNSGIWHYLDMSKHLVILFFSTPYFSNISIPTKAETKPKCSPDCYKLLHAVSLINVAGADRGRNRGRTRGQPWKPLGGSTDNPGPLFALNCATTTPDRLWTWNGPLSGLFFLFVFFITPWSSLFADKVQTSLKDEPSFFSWSRSRSLVDPWKRTSCSNKDQWPQVACARERVTPFGYKFFIMPETYTLNPIKQEEAGFAITLSLSGLN